MRWRYDAWLIDDFRAMVQGCALSIPIEDTRDMPDVTTLPGIGFVTGIVLGKKRPNGHLDKWVKSVSNPS